MITYLNVGPGRSGSTSFYKMCLNNNSINCGKIKEPIEDNLIKTDELYKYKINLKNYINNWEFNLDKDTILLDGSGQLPFILNLYEFKDYIFNYVNDSKFILLVRDPKKYYVSRLFINFLFEIEEDLGHLQSPSLILKNVNKLSLKNIDTQIKSKLKEKHYINRISYLNIIRNIEKIYDKDKIFILPIVFFNDYKLKLSKFLNVDFSNLTMPNVDTVNYELKSEKIKLIMHLIKEFVFNDKILDSNIKKDFKIIDNEYKSNLFNLYMI